jgi:ADP-heptose:LPS heptosyltransferase
VLAECLAGRAPAELPRELTEEACRGALFGVLAEGLGDRFEPPLCDVYARLFPQAIPGANEGWYRRVRRPRRVAGEPRRVWVLSRITLGADIAVTSVLLDAAKRRFPDAQIVFVGPRKNFELFEADVRLSHAATSYRRDAWQEVWRDLQAIPHDDLVIDPDSRLTQLGLLPIGSEGCYHLFESRGYGGASDRTLSDLASAWAEETFGAAGARPYLALSGADVPARPAQIAISLGVGENPAKRIADPFEEQLLALLARHGTLLIDRGAGGDEAARVERAVQRSGVKAEFWDGSFAGFAQRIAGSKLYVGYDSAGQHAAAALGVPLLCVFAGFPSPRMFERWRPASGNVIRVDEPDPAAVLERVRRHLG